MEKNKITAQLYTLRDFLRTPGEIRETMARVRKLGYEAVQVSGLGPIDPAELKEAVDEQGLQICVTHTPVASFRNDLPGVIRNHKLWNCKYVGLGAMPEEYRTGRQGYLKFAGEFSEIGKRLADQGLQFVYHNHQFEFEKFDGVTGLDLLLENTDPDAFGFEIDTYWVQTGGADPVEWIRKVKGRMGVVHLKDMAIINNEQVFAEIGEGNLNWKAILKACDETGVEWFAVEQDKCLRDPFESLAMSYRYLASLEVGCER